MIIGNLAIPANSTLEISTNGFLNVSGCITFNGSLVINVQDQHLSPMQTIQTIKADCFVGLPESVTITNLNKCQRVTQTSPSVDGNFLEILIGVNNVCGSNNTSIIIATVVVVVVVAAIVGLLLVRNVRHKVFPCTKKNLPLNLQTKDNVMGQD